MGPSRFLGYKNLLRSVLSLIRRSIVSSENFEGSPSAYLDRIGPGVVSWACWTCNLLMEAIAGLTFISWVSFTLSLAFWAFLSWTITCCFCFFVIFRLSFSSLVLLSSSSKRGGICQISFFRILESKGLRYDSLESVCIWRRLDGKESSVLSVSYRAFPGIVPCIYSRCSTTVKVWTLLTHLLCPFFFRLVRSLLITRCPRWCLQLCQSVDHAFAFCFKSLRGWSGKANLQDAVKFENLSCAPAAPPQQTRT